MPGLKKRKPSPTIDIEIPFTYHRKSSIGSVGDGGGTKRRKVSEQEVRGRVVLAFDNGVVEKIFSPQSQQVDGFKSGSPTHYPQQIQSIGPTGVDGSIPEMDVPKENNVAQDSAEIIKFTTDCGNSNSSGGIHASFEVLDAERLKNESGDDDDVMLVVDDSSDEEDLIDVGLSNDDAVVDVVEINEAEEVSLDLVGPSQVSNSESYIPVIDTEEHTSRNVHLKSSSSSGWINELEENKQNAHLHISASELMSLPDGDTFLTQSLEFSVLKQDEDNFEEAEEEDMVAKELDAQVDAIVLNELGLDNHQVGQSNFGNDDHSAFSPSPSCKIDREIDIKMVEQENAGSGWNLDFNRDLEEPPAEVDYHNFDENHGETEDFMEVELSAEPLVEKPIDNVDSGPPVPDSTNGVSLNCCPQCQKKFDSKKKLINHMFVSCYRKDVYELYYHKEIPCEIEESASTYEYVSSNLMRFRLNGIYSRSLQKVW
ncbi:hypothetical protein BDR26DRAFT_850419 [Obelidium mucronatum]|nr:hypothetical protein BDR26DRAFT_850419 [Obelidium mucronatum]